MLRIRDFFIPVPAYEFFSSRIPHPNFFHPRFRIGINEFKYFNPKKCFYALENMIRVLHPGSGSPFRFLIFYPFRVPDPGVKKALDPGSGSATLFFVPFPFSMFVIVRCAGVGRHDAIPLLFTAHHGVLSVSASGAAAAAAAAGGLPGESSFRKVISSPVEKTSETL